MKPYPKRLHLGERVFSEIITSIRRELRREAIVFNIEDAAGNATTEIVKVVQNNYRRRRKNK